MGEWDKPKDYEETPPDPDRAVLERLAFETLREQRRARRWSVFFKSFFALYLVGILFLFNFDEVGPPTGAHTALVDLDGVIASDGDVDADRIVGGLRAAFEADGAKGVILRINSPGGSPVQAAYINDEIKRLRGKYPDKPLYAVVSDLCASGGYYVAVAADRIYASPSSIVGSIGVRMDSFGLVGAMEKLGVERRLLTAGRHKGMLDPFLPVDPEERAHVLRLLEQVHEQFIKAVKDGRGDRLRGDEAVFSGLFWTGEEAKQLGLIDEFGSAGQVAREVIGERKIVDYTPHRNFLDRFAERIGVAVARTLSVETFTNLVRLR